MQRIDWLHPVFVFMSYNVGVAERSATWQALAQATQRRNSGRWRECSVPMPTRASAPLRRLFGEADLDVFDGVALFVQDADAALPVAGVVPDFEHDDVG